MITKQSIQEIVESDEFAERASEIMSEDLGSYIREENGRPEGVNKSAALAYFIFHAQYERAGHYLADLFEKKLRGLADDMYESESNRKTDLDLDAEREDPAYERARQEEVDRGS